MFAALIAAALSSGDATLLGVIVGLLVAIFGAVWRVGNKVGGFDKELEDHTGRLERLEEHEDAHDKWHRRRGIV